MALDQIETFLRRIMTDRDYCRRFLAEPEQALDETDLDTSERWAVLESLQEGDSTGQEFLALLRTRLAVVGIRIGQPPAELNRVFATAPDDPPA